MNKPHPVDRHVGQRVATLRLDQGLSQARLGDVLGLTFQQIQKYEKGLNRISSSKLWEISCFFGVDITYFFAGLGDRDQGSDATSTDPAPAQVTRYTIEIGKLAPRLPAPQQRLALDLFRELAGDC